MTLFPTPSLFHRCTVFSNLNVLYKVWIKIHISIRFKCCRHTSGHKKIISSGTKAPWIYIVIDWLVLRQVTEVIANIYTANSTESKYLKHLLSHCHNKRKYRTLNNTNACLTNSWTTQNSLLLMLKKHSIFLLYRELDCLSSIRTNWWRAFLMGRSVMQPPVTSAQTL